MSLTDPFCGKQTECLACGTNQDMKNGIARGQCAHCHIGYLKGFYIPTERKLCRYKNCGKCAVAADGKWPVCGVHLKKRRPDFICAMA